MLSGGGFPCAFYPESPRTRCWLLACKDRSRNILCFDFSATPAPEPLTQEECSQRHEGCGNSLLLASFVYDKRFASGQKEAFVNLRFLVITCICCCGLTVVGQKSAPTKKTSSSTAPQQTLVDRIGDTGFIQIKAESFHSLSAS